MPRAGVAVPREGHSHHRERVAAPNATSDRVAVRAASRVVPTARTDSPTASPAAPAAVRSEASPQRRTVTIRGHGSERYVSSRASSSRRRPERRYERSGFRPDRTAMWAGLLGLMLILAAAASAHAATLHAVAQLHLR